MKPSTIFSICSTALVAATFAAPAMAVYEGPRRPKGADRGPNENGNNVMTGLFNQQASNAFQRLGGNSNPAATGLLIRDEEGRMTTITKCRL